MDYVYFELTDYLEDKDFKRWVYSPTPELDQFWADFLKMYPEKSEIVSHARSMLLMLGEDFTNEYPEEIVVSNMWTNILENKSDRTISRNFPYKIRAFVLAASAAAVLLIISLLYQPEQKMAPVSYAGRVSQSKIKLTETKNATTKPILVSLPDNSSVLLQPESTISYPENFNTKSNREVFLSGEGFFKVTKNPKKPFIVYANEVVTRVLGTSFSVKAFDHDPNVEVEVKTGKVSVFAIRKENASDMDSYDAGEEVIVTPNQKLLYSRLRESMKKYLVELPEVVPSDFATPPTLDFQDASVSQIFADLERSYEIEIVYNKEQLGDCLLTASFTNESLYDKIDLICKGIEAEFKVENGSIIVAGKGCH